LSSYDFRKAGEKGGKILQYLMRFFLKFREHNLFFFTCHFREQKAEKDEEKAVSIAVGQHRRRQRGPKRIDFS
jgi:hypothetical protein